MNETFQREFGRYELLDEIGRGGMGVVYRARQKGLDRLVAVKMIRNRFSAVPELVARLSDEAQAAARVSHPNIVGIIETGVHDGQHFIAMEYVPGRSLAVVLSRGETDLNVLVRMIVDVARAVHHLHEQAILHLDLKPSNILVADDGRVVVTDFGLARAFGTAAIGDRDRESTVGTVAGTPSYIAPELLRSRTGTATPLCDVYSLGALLYELATGQPIFADSAPMVRLILAMEDDPVPPRAVSPELPPELEAVILQCLERKPRARYRSAAAVADDLECYLKGEPMSVAPAVGWPRVRRWIRRYPALAVRLMAFLVFMLLTLGDLVGGAVSAGFFTTVAVWLTLWVLVSMACQFLPVRGDQSRAPRLLWAAADAMLLTVVLRAADGTASPLVLVYPLTVVMAGFWGRVSLVVWVTGLALASYAFVWVDTAVRRPAVDVGLDRHLLFGIVVALTGIMVGMQVRRLRAITGFYADRF